MNGTVTHIVQYQGSKRNLAPQILPYFPQRFNRLIEPFAGMAAITIAVSRLNKAQSYRLNDLNTPLVSVLEEVINNPQRLLDDYTRVWSEQLTYEEGGVAHYYKVRDDFNNGNQCAANMLYLLARCVKALFDMVTMGNLTNLLTKEEKERHLLILRGIFFVFRII